MRLLTVLLLFSCATQFAQTSDERDAIATVQKVFDGMAAHDAAMIKSTLLPEARLYSVRGENAPSSTTGEAFANSIGASKAELLERFIGRPTVSIRGRMAQVWGEYEFLRDGKFTHCGVDTAGLFKTAEGWKIATLSYTVETTGCKGH
jgi:hypothetical protein